mmetsp:Transcript_116281/g.282194  ORF Transcript_116281/g.282194 Transcript_116281/m.282194 type:complete len:539 (-) Transcript_116281:41-1657(-)
MVQSLEFESFAVADGGMAADAAQDTASRTCCARLRANRRLLWSLVAAVALWLVACVVVYLTVPQIIVAQRIKLAELDIKECILAIGPNADSEVFPTARVSVSKSALQMPLISYKAHIKGFTATIWWKRQGEADDEDILEIGTIHIERGVDLDSSKDVDIELSGTVKVSNTRSMGQVANYFMVSKNITTRFTATVDVWAYVYGWIPVPFKGIFVGKDLTIPAMNEFKTSPPTLKEFTHVHGLPGELNISASAFVYNPTPATLVLRDSCQVQIYYTYDGSEYRVGTLYVDAPITLKPGLNLLEAMARIISPPAGDPTALAIKGFAGEYIGPQSGLSPAGMKPLLVRMADGTSESRLVRQATQFLSVDINFRPKPVYFLLALTCDVIAMASAVPPFYRAVVHLRVHNPLPQTVRLQEVLVEARHLNLSGPVLYHYNHHLDSTKFVLPPLAEITLDFELNPLQEISWGFLFSPLELQQLLKEASQQVLAGGVIVDLTVRVEDGYEQAIPYRNEAIDILLCFRSVTPSDLCGGLPPMHPPLLQ